MSTKIVVSLYDDSDGHLVAKRTLGSPLDPEALRDKGLEGQMQVCAELRRREPSLDEDCPNTVWMVEYLDPVPTPCYAIGE